MNNDPGKYIRLFVTILLSVLGFIAAMVLLFFLVRLFFGVLSYIPWIEYLFTIAIVSVPAAVFITAFIIYFKRTGAHPSKPVRIISYIIFTIFLLAWVAVYVSDIITLFKTGSNVIAEYYSWEMLFLSANVAVIFFIGVLQALSYPKQEDWYERGKRRELEGID